MKRLDRYRLKNPDFYAVQYDGLNGEDLAADLVLLGIKLFGWWEIEGEIGMETGKNALHLKTGDWLVWSPTGETRVYDDAKFSERFEKHVVDERAERRRELNLERVRRFRERKKAAAAGTSETMEEAHHADGV